MRVGIDARFLTHPQQGGFKSYTENLLRGLTEIDKSTEYFLYTDRPEKELSFDLPENFSVRPIKGASAFDREQCALPAKMWRDKVDFAHYLCNTGPLASPCPMVLTVHDLLACAKGWLTRCGSSAKSMAMCAYWRGVTPVAAKRAAQVITISETSRREIIKRIGIHPDKIEVIPTGVHPAFCVLRDSELLSKFRRRYDLPVRYVLAFAASDIRKNLHGILAAWDIVRSFVQSYWLVLVCASTSAERQIKEYCANNQNEKRVAILSGLPRDDLSLLYNGADVLLFPSFYEGFGLPVAEAMACGTPVITSSISVMQEIAGDAAIQIDPSDIPSIAKSLIHLLSDDELRSKLSMRGVERSNRYSWDRTVLETIKVYEKAFRGLKRGKFELAR